MEFIWNKSRLDRFLLSIFLAAEPLRVAATGGGGRPGRRPAVVDGTLRPLAARRRRRLRRGGARRRLGARRVAIDRGPRRRQARGVDDLLLLLRVVFLVTYLCLDLYFCGFSDWLLIDQWMRGGPFFEATKIFWFWFWKSNFFF